MEVSFEKWHGLKNDFIVVYIPAHDDLTIDSLKRNAPGLCSREGNGIGADGILVLKRSVENPTDLPTGLEIINSDGSIAQNCGNGLRCCAASIYRQAKKVGRLESILHGFTLDLRSFTAEIRFHNGVRGRMPYIQVCMGRPLSQKEVADSESLRNEIKHIISNLKLDQDLSQFSITFLGNPHVIFPVSESKQELIRKIGPALQKIKTIDGINVHTYHEESASKKDSSTAHNQIQNGIETILVTHTWERGAGETEACGSGACSVAYQYLGDGLTSREKPIAVDMPGGRLYVHQHEEESNLYMSGPAEYVFEGSFDI